MVLRSTTVDLWGAKIIQQTMKSSHLTYLWNLAKPCIDNSPDLSADIHSILLDFLAFEACQSLGKLSLCGLVRFIALWAKMKAQTKLYIPSTMKNCAYLLAATSSCNCSEISNHGLNHGLFLSLFMVFGWKHILIWLSKSG